MHVKVKRVVQDWTCSCLPAAPAQGEASPFKSPLRKTRTWSLLGVTATPAHPLPPAGVSINLLHWQWNSEASSIEKGRYHKPAATHTHTHAHTTPHTQYYKAARSCVSWTYGCSCRWSRTGSDTSGAPQRPPLRPATQARVSRAWGALRGTSKTFRCSGRRDGSPKTATSIRHGSSVKTWFQGEIRRVSKR